MITSRALGEIVYGTDVVTRMLPPAMEIVLEIGAKFVNYRLRRELRVKERT